VWRGHPRPRLLTLSWTYAGEGARATRNHGGCERSWHLHSRLRTRLDRGSSRRQVWRLAADRALRALIHDAAGRTSPATTLAMDASGGSFRPHRSIHRVRGADREAVPGSNIRVVSRLPDRDSGCVWGSDGQTGGGGVVEVRKTAVSSQLSVFCAALMARPRRNA
jgi:hypothetical protein